MNFNTLTTENDVEITNVSTIITHGKIKVLWKLLNSNQQINTLNGPVTFTVKYKVMSQLIFTILDKASLFMIKVSLCIHIDC